MAAKGLRRRPGTENPFYSANNFNFVTFTIGASASHIVNVAVALTDPDGQTLKVKAACRAYLSSDAAGLVQATAPAQGVTIGTNGLAIALVTGVAWEIITSATGLFDLNIAVNAGGTYYLNIILPDGTIVTSGAIVVT